MITPMGITQVAAGSLVAAAWEGLVLAGVVAICLRLLPGITAAARSVVWTVVMVVVCVLPFLHVGGGAAAGTDSGQIRLDERIGLALVVVWAAISAVRAAQLVRSALWLRGISRRAVPVEDCSGSEGEILGFFASLRMTSGAGRQAELCVSDEVDRPCVAGFFKPRILIPTELFAEISDSELRQIVLHELERLRRRDDWTNLLQKLSLVLFPLNPALIWIERQLCVERELACDDQVLKATGARKAYAACLANLAEHSLVRRGVSLALGAWERQSELVRRVHRILSRNERDMGRGQVAAVVAVLILGVAGAADGLAHAPALVSFGPGVVAVAGAKAHVVGGIESGGMKPTSAPVIPVRATDVVYRPEARKVRPHSLKVRKVSKPMVNAMELAPQPGRGFSVPSRPEPMVVMVTWRVASPMIVHDTQFSYAAVPTRDGWLFVQL